MGKYVDGLVSVIIPTYKRSEKLTRAIESVLNQTYTNIELLVVNDNDPNDDYTIKLIERVKPYENDKRFRLIMQDKHINGAVARNVGIKQAQGEYIAFLDDDDWWDKDKLSHQVSTLSKLSPEWGGVSCRIKRYNNQELIAKMPRYESGYVYKDILMLKSDFATGTILVRHEALDEAGLFDEKLLRHQDLQLLVNFTFKYKLFQLNEFLHCCDVSDAQNRPDLEKLIIAKKAFFYSVRSILKTLTPRERKCVKSMHHFEVAYVALNNRNIKPFFHHLTKALRSLDGIGIFTKKAYIKIMKKDGE